MQCSIFLSLNGFQQMLRNYLQGIKKNIIQFTQMSNNLPIHTLQTLTKRNFSSSKNLSQTLECQTVQSRLSELPTLDHSTFSTTYSVKRVNEIKPKPKLIMPEKVSSIRLSQKIEKNSTKQNLKQSLKYESIKSPLFNWRRLIPMCGFQSKTGESGCLCGNPCPLQKQWTKHYKESDFKLYQQLLGLEINKSQEVQIEKDILRTHSECLTFTNNVGFQQMLKEVLRQYSVYDPQVGYVQGMNLVVGVILYHMKNAELTFWAFVDLMDEQQLRMIYLPGFEFLNLHQTRILQIMDKKVHDLLQRMNELSINPSSFLNGWILSLMGVCIPLQYMHLLIQKFRKLGWNYIYQIIITYLLFLKESLMRAQEESEFLMCLDLKSSREYGAVWEELIQNAVKFPLHSLDSLPVRK